MSKNLLRASGAQVVNDRGRPVFLKGMSGFRDYAKHLEGTLSDDVLKESADLGANYRRTLGMMHYITRFYPDEHPDFYARLPEFCDRLWRFRLFAKIEVLADAQIIMPDWHRQVEHVDLVWEQLTQCANAIGSLGNEAKKNGFDATRFRQPDGLFCSQGSALADAPPPQPGWSFHDWHGRRDWPKVTSATEDSWYISQGAPWPSTIAGTYPIKPIIHDEPIGFGEHEESGRRSTNKYLARQIAVSARVLCAGVLFHSDAGIHSERLGVITKGCAVAFFRGSQAIRQRQPSSPPQLPPWGEGPRPPIGRFKLDGRGGCVWDPSDMGPDQCIPS